MAIAETSWSEVWRLHAENRHVFGAVFADLRANGLSIDRESALDYVHEFLLERAPRALATFRPERGEIQGWLFVVFRRYVLGAMQARARQDGLLRAFSEQATSRTSEPVESASDIAAVQAALAALPSEQRRAARVFVRSKEGSLREVARTLSISRWKAGQLVTAALAALAARLGATDEPEIRRSFGRVRRILETTQEGRDS